MPQSTPSRRRPQKRRGPTHNGPRHGLRPRLEALETRDVPSATINISDATIRVQGNLTTFIPGNGSILTGPRGMAFGPDRNGDSVQDLYVIGGNSNNIVVYDGTTGAFVETYVPTGAGLNLPGWLAFDAAGNLFTSIVTSTSVNNNRNAIVRVDHATRVVSTFVSDSANGGLEAAKGLTFGADGNLYVADAVTNQVLRYNGNTGVYLGAFVSAESGGLSGAAEILFGPDRTGDAAADVYVASNDTDQVLVFDGVTGDPLGAFVAAGSGGLDGPHDMQFGPDGHLYVVSSLNTYNLDYIEQVYRFDGATGAFIDVPVAVGGGLGGATAFIAFGRQGDLLVSGQGANEVLRLSTGPLVTLSEPSASPVTVEFGTTAGTAAASDDFAAVAGRLTFAPGETSKRILVSPVDDGVSEASETFTVTLGIATGAIVGDGQGEVTLLNSQTKFFVVNDMTTSSNGAVIRDKTFKYESGGGLVVANDEFFGGYVDTAVRGVASNVAGTRLWVLDANGTVYVCDNRNVFVGSWTAGGLNPLAQLEGITTDGTDVWLVDAKQDRVYRFAGAAGRLSGSQNPVSSFNLISGNKNPKDLVTDGTSIWVVDDAGTDRVFKYSLSGTYQGSWTVSGSGGAPTGITLDPSNAQQHLWVVDNATDRVYQFDSARSRTSGSQAASTTFALAVGNTNPQGIADPPALTIADATAVEGGPTYRFTDTFVAPDGYGLAAIRDIRVGPDGNVYVASHDTDVVKVFEGGTGRFLRDHATSGGELDGPWGMAFGADGRLYVGGRYSYNIVRFDIGTGSYDVLVGAQSGGLRSPWGLAFGPDGNLYATSHVDGAATTDAVKRFNGATGAYLGDFVAPGSRGLNDANGLGFGPDGNLYVASNGSVEVKRYNGVTGAFINNFVYPGSGGLVGPRQVSFPGDGYLYVGSQGDAGSFNPRVIRYDAATGAFVDVFAPAPLPAYSAFSFAFASAGEAYVSFGMPTLNSGSYVARFAPSRFAAFTVSLDTAATVPVNVNFTTANGTALAGSDYTAASGTLTFAPGQTSRTILVRTVDDALAEPTETFVVNLSNPVGATIARGQAVGTITDNDPPAVRVNAVAVNGGSAQRSRVTQVAVSFSTQVAFAGPAASAFRLSRIGGGAVGGFSATASTVGGVTVVTLANFAGAETESGSLADGRYALTVVANQITTPGGLDGNGDGTAGDDYVFNGTPVNGLYRYYGDSDGNGVVDGLDFFALRSTFNLTSTQAGYLAHLDFNGDGIVDGLDFFQFRSRFNSTVP